MDDNRPPTTDELVNKHISEAQTKIAHLENQVKNLPPDNSAAPGLRPPGAPTPINRAQQKIAIEQQIEQIKKDTVEKVGQELKGKPADMQDRGNRAVDSFLYDKEKMKTGQRTDLDHKQASLAEKMHDQKMQREGKSPDTKEQASDKNSKNQEGLDAKQDRMKITLDDRGKRMVRKRWPTRKTAAQKDSNTKEQFRNNGFSFQNRYPQGTQSKEQAAPAKESKDEKSPETSQSGAKKGMDDNKKEQAEKPADNKDSKGKDQPSSYGFSFQHRYDPPPPVDGDGSGGETKGKSKTDVSKDDK